LAEKPEAEAEQEKSEDISVTDSWIQNMENQIEEREDLRIRLLFVSRRVRVIFCYTC